MGLSRAFSKVLKEFPSGYTQFMAAVDFGLGPSYEVVIVGPRGSKDTQGMLKALRGRYIPNSVTLLRPTNEDTSEIDRLAPFIIFQQSLDGKSTAYVCQNNACKAPTTDVSKMMELLNQ